MNPLVEQMLTTKSRNDLELAMLEQSFEEDCKCQSKMHLSGCTEHVTHRGTNCLAPNGKNICDDAVKYARAGIATDAFCGDCGKTCSDCWAIRPI